MKVLVSSCLLGYNCKYNGGNNYNYDIVNLSEDVQFVPICPEVFGGLPIPRKPSEQVFEKVLTQDGDDFTENFKIGAEVALDLAVKNECKYAILKSKSPSCGYGKIYDGTFSHTLIDGNGVATKLLIENGIQIYNEDTFCELLKKIK